MRARCSTGASDRCPRRRVRCAGHACRGAAIHAAGADRAGERLVPGVQAAREGVEAADAQLSQATRLVVADRAADLRHHRLAGRALHRSASRASRGPTGGDQQRALPRTARAPTWSTLRSGEQVLPYHGVAFNLGINLVQPLYTFGKIEAARNGGQGRHRRGARAGRQGSRRGHVQRHARLLAPQVGARRRRPRSTTALGRLKEWVKKINDDIDKGKTTYTENDLVRLKLALDAAELTRARRRQGAGARPVGRAHAHRRCRTPTSTTASSTSSIVARAAARLLRGRGAHASARGAHAGGGRAGVARGAGAAAGQPACPTSGSASRSPTPMHSRSTIRRTPS